MIMMQIIVIIVTMEIISLLFNLDSSNYCYVNNNYNKNYAADYNCSSESKGHHFYSITTNKTLFRHDESNGLC